MHKYAWIIAVLVLFVTGFLFQKLPILQTSSEAEVIASECDLRQGPCEIQLGEYGGVFSILPNDFQVLQPLQLELKSQTEAVSKLDQVSVEFEGINMDMGYNRVFLEEQDSQTYHAKAMLPSCTADTMFWLIHLIINDSSGVTDFQFRLQTKNP
ncbi:MAG: hypothetical protein HKP55_02530 [Gammaproteobacteria bacterium]|nr:hypothetical protein [Gammaproteobacteria bacterium]